ncbi:unnamed protein product, partial [Musa hybrid cultivar]
AGSSQSQRQFKHKRHGTNTNLSIQNIYQYKKLKKGQHLMLNKNRRYIRRKSSWKTAREPKST